MSDREKEIQTNKSKDKYIKLYKDGRVEIKLDDITTKDRDITFMDSFIIGYEEISDTYAQKYECDITNEMVKEMFNDIIKKIELTLFTEDNKEKPLKV